MHGRFFFGLAEMLTQFFFIFFFTASTNYSVHLNGMNVTYVGVNFMSHWGYWINVGF